MVKKKRLSIKEAIRTGRAWWIRPGTSGENWDDWKSRKTVSLGIYSIELSKYYDSDGEYKDGKEKSKKQGIDKEIDRIIARTGKPKKKWHKDGRSRTQKIAQAEIQLHDVARIQAGDLIFAHATGRGKNSTVLGIGEVTGNYVYNKVGKDMNSGSKHHHSYSVDWFDQKGIKNNSLPKGSGARAGGTIVGVKEINSSWLTGKKVNHWLFPVDEPNWPVVKKLNIWDSHAKLDTLNGKIKPGDKAIFYQYGSCEDCKNFRGAFTITTEWIDAKDTPNPWPSGIKWSDGNRIELQPIAVGDVPLKILEQTQMFNSRKDKIMKSTDTLDRKKMKVSKLFGTIMQNVAKIAGNDAKPMAQEDFDLIVERMNLASSGGGTSGKYTELAEKTGIKVGMIDEISEELEEQKQIIFVGPPGTSKTFFAQEFAKVFTEDENNVEIIQFHPSYNYEDFVEGIRPKIQKGKINQFEVAKGILKRIVVYKCGDGKKHVLIIDEINRGNIARIFGELIYLLEYREKDISLTYSPKEKFKIPSNLYIIGTMNTADRSIGSIDYALRRRFTWFEFSADKEILEKFLMKNGTTSKQTKQICDLMEQVNAEIEDSVVGKDCQIGQTYFMKKDMTEEKMKKIFNRKILPLLKEYYFADKAKIETITELFEKFKLSS